jgi:hypothetical protein
MRRRPGECSSARAHWLNADFIIHELFGYVLASFVAAGKAGPTLKS